MAEELEEFYAIETLKKLKYIGHKIWVSKISLFRSRKIFHLTAENFPGLVNSVSNNCIDVFLGFNLYKHLYALFRTQPLSFEDFHKLLSEKEDSWWSELIGSTCLEFKLKGLNLKEGYMQNREFKAALLKSISVKVGNPLVLVAYYRQYYESMTVGLEKRSEVEKEKIKIKPSPKAILNEALCKCSKKLTRLDRELLIYLLGRNNNIDEITPTEIEQNLKILLNRISLEKASFSFCEINNAHGQQRSPSPSSDT